PVVQPNRGPEVLQLFAERIRQTGKPSAMSAKRQILLFDVAGRNMVRVGRAADRRLAYRHDRGRAVPTARGEWVRCSERLYNLAVVHLPAEPQFDRIDVGAKRIARKLDAIPQPVREVCDESIRVGRVPLADPIARDQFGVRVDGDKSPNVSGVLGLVAGHSARLLSNEAPNLIDLDALARQIAHQLVEQPLAALANPNPESHDRVPVNARDALNGSNT